MIKNIKFFLKNDSDALKTGKLVKEKMELNGFCINNKYELAISIGDYELFKKVIKIHNYSDYINYCFIDLNYFNEEQINKLIDKIKNDEFRISKLELLKLKIDMEKYLWTVFAEDKIEIKNSNSEIFNPNIYVGHMNFDNVYETGILISKSSNRKTMNNIICPGPSVIQIVPLNHQNSLANSIIVPTCKKINVALENQKILLNIDDINNYYFKTSELEIETIVKKVKSIKLDNYNNK